MTPVYVALGGAIGAVLRYGVGLLINGAMATLAVNIVGGFFMGLAFVLFAPKGMDGWQPFVMTGILGGFTTFSAFSLDVMKMMDGDNLAGAALYVILSVVLSVFACGMGVLLAKGLIA